MLGENLITQQLKDLRAFNTWNADNKFNEAFFARVYYQISVANEFLKLNEKLNLKKSFRRS